MSLPPVFGTHDAMPATGRQPDGGRTKSRGHAGHRPYPPHRCGRERTDGFLPTASAGGKNLTEAIGPEATGPPLIRALRVVDDFAQDAPGRLGREPAADQDRGGIETVSGLAPPAGASAARAGSTKPGPVWTRRIASTSCSGGESFTTWPAVPADIARQR